MKPVTATPVRFFALRGHQGGAVLVEFSLILIALLTLLYGIIIYSIVFVTQQAVAFAAESGADAIVAVDPAAVVDPDNPATTGFSVLAADVATGEVNRLLGFLPGDASVCLATVGTDPQCIDQCVDTGANRQCFVRVSYSFANWGFPVTGLFPLPETIRATGLVNLGVPAS